MVIVVGAGRSGTNIALEMLRGNSGLKASVDPEDKKIFTRDVIYNDNYLTKCDITYFTEKDLYHAMNRNPSMKIIFTIRDPRDMYLSKAYRGRPIAEGGDCLGYPDDGTPDGFMRNMNKFVSIYNTCFKLFPERQAMIKMEDLLNRPRLSCQFLCEFLNLHFEEKMIYFWKRMRNKHKSNRYKIIDKSQIEIWKNWKTAYNGFFKDKDVESVFKKSEKYIKLFGYK